MPVGAARPISPTATERHRLKKAAWGHKAEYRLRVRAQIVLHAARGLPNARIAERVGVHVDTVRTWRSRFAELGMPGLADRKRTGRAPSFTPLQATQVKALARQTARPTGTPLSRWTTPELAREAVKRGIAPFLSASTVRRWLARDALKPWQPAPGSSSPTPTSAPRPRASWIYTPAPGTASRSARTNSSSAPTRRPRSRPVVAATPPSSPARPARCA
ncbi:helix-turn-helix domain-containing protein [Streptomyces sp. NBC_00005]|uniref:helix-turn-helix domain-containing protein n=1 Tax=Streptomyces sp. NBC_00005 TaxID=2903609 RepID=UPI003254D7CB